MRRAAGAALALLLAACCGPQAARAEDAAAQAPAPDRFGHDITFPLPGRFGHDILPMPLASRFGRDMDSASADGEAGAASDTGVRVLPYALPDVGRVEPSRFGKIPDAAYGAFQRGLYITAYQLALPRAQAGDGAAQTLVAEILAQGLGVRLDAKAAAQWYKRAAERGVPAAQFQYALLLVDGHYVDKDTEQAYALMQDAANSGNRLAEFNFAEMIVERDPGASGVARAASYYEKAAEAGLPDAQYAMAQLYANGTGGKPLDKAEARKWLASAAVQNYDTAQLDLGTWLVEGIGGPADAEAGFAWLGRAARSGNVAAQNRLAKLYRAGVGTDADAVAAAAWYITAHRAGLDDPDMDLFLEGLTDQERKQALGEANRLF